MANLLVGLIGAGVFGGYHAGKIAASEHAEFLGVYDPDLERAQQIADAHNVHAAADLDQFLAQCDAVMIASPAIYHETLVAKALQANCHTMVEKPLALTQVGADDLVMLADRKGLILQVGHQERFVLEAMGLFDIAERPQRIDAWRMGPAAPNGRATDVSVVWDLMIHDLDMAARLLGLPDQIEATGRRAHTDYLDEATARLSYADAVVDLRASRAAAERDRGMTLQYPSGTISIDFLSRQIENTTPFAIEADVSSTVPDPLAAADESFFAACLGKQACVIPGADAAKAVQLAESVERSATATIGA
ncbi:MAG: Gfo/Idh/MocA family oxidoreductase [Pseudomonadota bacterium]